MPIYEYECGFCGNIKEELFLSFEEAEGLSIRCPECNWEMRRIVSLPRKALLTQEERTRLSHPQEYIDEKPRRRILKGVTDGNNSPA